MKYAIRTGDLVCYKGQYAENKGKQYYKLGLVTKMTKCSLGRQLTILWNNGNITETSVHLIRKIRRRDHV